MRLLIAICLLATSSVLAQTSGTITGQSPPPGNSILLSLPTTQVIIPSPVWVADPSAGHYDCPEGWLAYTRSEPEVYQVIAPVPAVYRAPNCDKKGHVLNEQPPLPICIQEKP